MQAMILAAGKGTRMLPLTMHTPKPLIKVNKQYLIEYTINNLRDSGITDIVINVHHLAAQIKHALGNGNRWGVTIKYSEEPILLDTGGGIFQALQNNLLDPLPFLVVSADLITNFKLAELSNKLIPKATISKAITLPQLAHLILVPNPDYKLLGDFSLNDGYLNFPNPKNPAANYTYANMGIFDPKFFANVPETIFPLINLFQKYIKTQQITGEIYSGLWKNIGTLDELNHNN